MSDNISSEEVLRLSEVEDFIHIQLKETTKELSELKKYIYEQRKRTWNDFVRASEHPEQNMQELSQMAQTEQSDVARYQRLEKLKDNLDKLADVPYFARIDVCEEGDTDKIYIGRRALMDEDASEMLVCDWRSDIASLFYDSGLGKTSYTCPMGKVECEVKTKRQFVIRNGEIKYQFDSDVAVEDDILIHELGKDSQNKMKTVVGTIQKEQNEIIRDTKSRVCLVQGVAGSGKTSIALHRLAYLLYKFRDSFAAGDIMIFSPNRVFDSYIADVLPDLGEDRVVQRNFFDLFSPYFDLEKQEDSSKQTEKLFAELIEVEEVVKKGNEKMCSAIMDKTVYYADKRVSFEDVSFYGTLIFSKEELEKIYFQHYSIFTQAVRNKRIIEDVEEKLDKLIPLREKIYVSEITDGGIIEFTDEELKEEISAKKSEDKKKILDDVRNMIGVNSEEIYLSILSDIYPEYAEKTRADFDNNVLSYSDFFPCVLIKILLGQIEINSSIKHVVIDEAQDYPYVLYKAVSILFPNAKFTILGDLAQGLIPHLQSIASLEPIFENMEVSCRTLTKSYRSTVEINEYASRFAKGNSDYSFFERHGEAVEYTTAEHIPEILEKHKDYTSKAIVCKTLGECEKLYGILTAQGIELTLIGKEDILYPDRTIIVPSYLTKGLEFDVVVVATPEEEWKTSSERHALYVSLSRALHKLYVCK